MAHVNKVLRSIETPDGDRCVDVFVRPDRQLSASRNIAASSKTDAAGSPIGFHGEQAVSFDRRRRAGSRQRRSVPWLKPTCIVSG